MSARYGFAQVPIAGFQRVLPNVVIDPSRDTATDVMTTERGFRLAVTLGGAVTGLGVLNVLIAFWEIAHFNQSVRMLESHDKPRENRQRRTES